MVMNWSERTREITFGLGLLLVVALGFGAVEAVARWYVGSVRDRNVDWKAMTEAAASQKDADDMVRYRPHARFGKMVFNEHGFRGPALAEPAPDGLVRLAFVGDSKVFSANFSEESTLAAQTTRRLSAAFPHCRFDYVTMAGPGYTLPFLAKLWAEYQPRLKPDLAVVLAGSPFDLVRFHDAAAPAAQDIRSQQAQERTPGLVDRSAFFTLLSRELRLASPFVTLKGSGDLPWTRLSQSYAQMTAGLVEATRGTPLIAIGYRSRLRAEQDARQKLHSSRELRQSIPGLSVSAAVQLSDFVGQRLAEVARTAGWHFIDPIQAMPGDNTHFIDRTHFTETGLARLADALSVQIAPRIGPACRVAA